MNLMRYKNELMLLGSVLFMLISYAYKYHNESKIQEDMIKVQKETDELIEANSLQKLWANKTISQRLNSLQSIVPSNKLVWNKKGKKLNMKLSNLNAKELNKVLSKISNIAVQIESIDIKRHDKEYDMEVRCKW